MEYWNPTSDTYRSKRTNESVPEENMLGIIDPTGHDTDSSIESETVSNVDSSEDMEYWDPVSDTYRSKKTNKSVPEESMQGMSEPTGYETDSSIESETAPSVDLDPWEYWDPVSNPYRSNKTNNNAQIENERRGCLMEKN